MRERRRARVARGHDGRRRGSDAERTVTATGVPAPATRSSRRAALGVLVACAAQFLIGADGLAVAIALPALQADLGAAPIDAQWVLTGYGLAFGGTLLLGGRLGDLYGRRRLLAWGMTAFAGGSVLAGLAPALPALVGARVMQGLGAAAAVPAALALIGSLVAPGPARTRALSLLAALASVGLLLGGLVTAVLGWRWVFLLMAPPAAVAAAIAPRLLPEVRADSRAQRPDVVGAVLVTAALVAILFALTRVERSGIAAAVTIAPLAAGVALLVAFAAWERRAPAPLMRFEILRVRSLRAASLGAGINAVAFTSIVYVGTLYLQLVLRYSPLEAGVALLPLDAVAFVLPLAVAGPIARRSPRVLLAGSFALTAVALLWLARAPAATSYVRDILVPLVVLGASLSVAFVVLTHEAVADVDADEKGLASGIFETANHLFGGAVGVALYATVLTATSAATSDPAGYRAAFLVAALLAGFGLAVARVTPRRKRIRTE
jgi:EmrB/QacA subfamily drug resistance transporter